MAQNPPASPSRQTARTTGPTTSAVAMSTPPPRNRRPISWPEHFDPKRRRLACSDLGAHATPTGNGRSAGSSVANLRRLRRRQGRPAGPGQTLTPDPTIAGTGAAVTPRRQTPSVGTGTGTQVAAVEGQPGTGGDGAGAAAVPQAGTLGTGKQSVAGRASEKPGWPGEPATRRPSERAAQLGNSPGVNRLPARRRQRVRRREPPVRFADRRRPSEPARARKSLPWKASPALVVTVLVPPQCRRRVCWRPGNRPWRGWRPEIPVARPSNAPAIAAGSPAGQLARRESAAGSPSATGASSGTAGALADRRRPSEPARARKSLPWKARPALVVTVRVPPQCRRRVCWRPGNRPWRGWRPEIPVARRETRRPSERAVPAGQLARRESAAGSPSATGAHREPPLRLADRRPPSELARARKSLPWKASPALVVTVLVPPQCHRRVRWGLGSSPWRAGRPESPVARRPATRRPSQRAVRRVNSLGVNRLPARRRQRVRRREPPVRFADRRRPSEPARARKSLPWKARPALVVTVRVPPQ